MSRILFFIFLAFLVWLAVRVLGGARRHGIDRSPEPRPDEPASRKAIETITQCAWCGVHVPAADALALPDGRVYCGIAHRDRARSVDASPDRSRS